MLFFGNYLYVKIYGIALLQRYWLSKILVIWLNASTFQSITFSLCITWEKTFLIYLIFLSELYLMWPYHPQTNQNAPVTCFGQIWTSLGTLGQIQLAVIVCYIDILMMLSTKNPVEHILFYNLKLCLLLVWKNTFAHLKSILLFRLFSTWQCP